MHAELAFLLAPAAGLGRAARMPLAGEGGAARCADRATVSAGKVR